MEIYRFVYRCLKCDSDTEMKKNLWGQKPLGSNLKIEDNNQLVSDASLHCHDFVVVTPCSSHKALF